jgi:hypothetical protein
VHFCVSAFVAARLIVHDHSSERTIVSPVHPHPACCAGCTSSRNCHGRIRPSQRPLTVRRELRSRVQPEAIGATVQLHL